MSENGEQAGIAIAIMVPYDTRFCHLLPGDAVS